MLSDRGDTQDMQGVGNASERWDQTIRPRATLLSLNLKDVWRYRDLLFIFVHRDFVAFYKQTVLGPLWFFLQPIMTTLVYVMVFGRIAGLPTDGLPRPLFYLSGIIFWNYFSDCLNKTSHVFRENAYLFGKVYFPRIIVPLSVVVSNLVRLSIQLLLLFLVAAYYWSDGRCNPNWMIVFIPAVVITLAALGLGLGMIFSSLTTKYRDLAFLLQFLVQLLMYATPIIYPLSKVPEGMRFLIECNPLTPLIEITRYALLGQGTFTAVGVAFSVGVTFVVSLLAIVVFNQVEKTFIDTV